MKTLALMAFLLVPFFVAAPLSAQSLDELCAEPSVRAENSSLCREYEQTRGETAENNRIIDFLGEVVSILLYGIGVATVIVIIVGGIMYTVSAGDPQKVQRAKSVILYALIGLVIAVAAQLIILFVLDRL